MGVPAFFRWLTTRYPKVVIDALSEDDLQMLETEYAVAADNNEIELDDDLALAASLNKNQKQKSALQRKIEENNPAVDNMYFDMNGIIHPCAHPSNGDP